MTAYRCTRCGIVRTWTADEWQYHRATTADHRGPARYSNDPSRPSALHVTLPPPCPECGGPADTGAGHDCEPMAQYDADRAALARAYARETDAIFAREARRARDYDDGIIHDDDH